MKKQLTALSIILISVAMMASCTNSVQQQKLNPLLSDSQNIVSTRPQNTTQILAILKLKNPALLETATKQNGKSLIDSRLLKEILTEQESTILALKQISSDIQIVYRYKMVLNGLAVLVPIEFAEQLKLLGQIAYSEQAGTFARPKTFELTSNSLNNSFSERNSAKFIGAEKLNLEGITGRGIKVGVIDTGIDYTHSMFRGEGTEEAYKAINPDLETKSFPNDRVVGGIDLVGTEFNAASAVTSQHIPKPDMNPIDQAGHGTHVAGTVAGLGDGVNSYNGMAPEALLYAIKVFGADGSTSDTVVIAALEYSADPNNDGLNDDQLDVVNLSLGSGYGNPHILYSEAIKNLVNGGTSVVASAGNSGHSDYIVGAPGTSTDALSVAASVDDGDQNWKFNSSKISIGAGDSAQEFFVEAIEASTTKKISEAGNVIGKLVYVGKAAEDFTPEQKASLKGNVALIDRGAVSFNDKMKRAADAGAIGVVVMNNTNEATFVMGTAEPFNFPAIMVTQAIGVKIKEALKNADAQQAVAQIEFLSAKKIEKPELIDRLTDFSSKGPRSVDGYLKPEISAPGSNVISADMGKGSKTVQMSGTSMAAPHMAGVMALLKQAHPGLTALELKSIAMGTATTIGEDGNKYALSMQGSGRIQADKAARAMILVEEGSISLGEIAVESKKSIRKNLTVKNLTANEINLSLTFEGNGFIQMSSVSNLTLKANEQTKVAVTLTLDATKMTDESLREMDGWVKFNSAEKEIYRVPVLAIAHKLSAIQAQDLVVQASSERDADGAAVSFTLNNANQNKGEVLLFNLIAQDDRKPMADSYMTSECDMQSAGYKLMTKKNEQGQNEQILQIAIKTFKPMTTWHACDFSVLIDSNQDGIAEQELLGSTLKSIPGLIGEDFASTLIDATEAREIRKDYEKQLEEAQNDPKKLADLADKENYTQALVSQRGMTLFNNSTVVVIEALVSDLAKTPEGNLAFKIVTTHNEQSSVQVDDYLNTSEATDMLIALKEKDQAFIDLPEAVTLQSEEKLKLNLTKGSAEGSLLLLMPQNKFSFSDLYTDAQSQILKPLFKAP